MRKFPQIVMLCPGAPREKDTQYLGGGEGPRHAEPIRGTLNYPGLSPKGLIATVPRHLEETAIMTCDDMWSMGRQGVGLGDLRGRWGAFGPFRWDWRWGGSVGFGVLNRIASNTVVRGGGQIRYLAQDRI